MGGFRTLRGLVAGDRRAKKSRRRSSLFEWEAQLDIVRHLEGAAAYPEVSVAAVPGVAQHKGERHDVRDADLRDRAADDRQARL